MNFPKLNGYKTSFEKWKNTFFLFRVKDKIRFRKCIEIVNKVKYLISKHFDVKTNHDNRYTITKINFSKDKIRTDFHND